MTMVTIQMDDSMLERFKEVTETLVVIGRASKEYAAEHTMHSALDIGLTKLEETWPKSMRPKSGEEKK